ncbi:response regulator [Bacterioplanoides sp.]|uniref:response regulator n=1 Tax=Bacterioplanoides sp. TaxID=2066072 RepID=UPI003AFF9FC8
MQWNLLLVDDEADILQTLRRLLRSDTLTIFEASNASEALAIFEQHDIHLMVTDYKMPLTDGLTLCREVRQRYPATYRILLSGQVDYPVLQQAWRNGDVHRFIAKPWDNLLLSNDITEGLKQHQLMRKALFLRHNVQGDQPLLLTDANWVIRLANPSMCAALGVEEPDLVGINLFSANVSAMPFELEAEITTQVESSHSWLGYFSFLPQSEHKISAWMVATSVSEHYRVCLCRFVSKNMPPPTDYQEELKRYARPQPPQIPGNGLQPDSQPVNDSSSANTNPDYKTQDFKTTALFNPSGQVVALKTPHLSYDQSQWQAWMTAILQAWQDSFSGVLTLVYDAQQAGESNNRTYLSALKQLLAALDNPKAVDPVIIVNESQLLDDSAQAQQLRSDWLQAGCRLFVANFGRSFLNSRQIPALPIQGVVLAPEFLPNMSNSKSLPQSKRLLQRIHSHRLRIYAPDIHSTDALAAAHQSEVDWLSGDVLSPPLSAEQLAWFKI